MWTAIAVIVVAAIAGIALASWLVSNRKMRTGEVRPGTHSHLDGGQRRPLHDALAFGYSSVEADVWPVDGELLVAHDREDVRPGGSLRRLYLEPLAERAKATGWVYPDTQFQLVVDFKADPDTSYRILTDYVSDFHDVLTCYRDGTVEPGPISIVITGKCPRETVAAESVRYFACDGSLGDVGSDVPATLVPLLSEKLGWRFTWRGRGPMPPEERAKLRDLVSRAHAEGRKVRFWDVPLKPRHVRAAIWRELQEAGVDYLGADRLTTLVRYLRKQHR